jgi:hypothetical protein
MYIFVTKCVCGCSNLLGISSQGYKKCNVWRHEHAIPISK